MLFYRSCIDQPLTEAEAEFLFDLGELFQMTNDINDASRDRIAGEITCMTAGLTLTHIRTLLETRIQRAFDSGQSFHTGENASTTDLFRRIDLLLGRSLVTLDRYRKIHSPDLPFDIRKIPPRKVVSGLKIPVELRSWYNHYRRLLRDQNANP